VTPALLSLAAVGFQAGIAALLVVSVRRGNGAATVNGVVSLAASLAPAVLTAALVRGGSTAVALDPALPFWLAVAGFLHTYGMLGPYETVWWWDHLTHTVSAALLAALVYALVLVSGDYAPPMAASLTLLLTLGLGGVWEVLELVAREVGDRYGVEPVLVHYGWRDTAYDLVFDAVGTLLVLAVDLRIFVPAVEQVWIALG